MAIPLKKIPLDPPETIAKRMRENPVDTSTVLCLTSEGALVMHLGQGMTFKWEDGRELPYAPWKEPIEYDSIKSLKRGTINAWEYRWIHPKTLARQSMNRWQKVKKKDNEVYVPFAFGEAVDDLIWNVDTILCKRPREYGDEVRRGIAADCDITNFLNKQDETLKSEVPGAISSTFVPIEEDEKRYTPVEE